MESVNFDISFYEYSLCSEHNLACVNFCDNIGFGAPWVHVSMWRYRKCNVCVHLLLKGFNIAVAFPLTVMKALIMQGQSSDWQPVIKNPIPGHICAKQREARTHYIKDIISTCFGKTFTMQKATKSKQRYCPCRFVKWTHVLNSVTRHMSYAARITRGY